MFGNSWGQYDNQTTRLHRPKIQPPPSFDLQHKDLNLQSIVQTRILTVFTGPRLPFISLGIIIVALLFHVGVFPIIAEYGVNTMVEAWVNNGCCIFKVMEAV